MYRFVNVRHVLTTGAALMALSSVGLVAASSSLPSAAVGTPTVTRLAGADRYATAVAVSVSQFKPGGVGTLVVASGEDAHFPDALAGGPTASAYQGPILLVQQATIPAVTAAEIARLTPYQIVVLGGPDAVSDSVVTQLNAMAYKGAYRLAGADRYATAAAVSAGTFDTPPYAHVYVATGETFPDALTGADVAGIVDGPVLLVQHDTIPAATVTELTRLKAANITIFGGTGAVSADVSTQLGSYATTGVTRQSGADRYATAAAISAAQFTAGASTVYVSTGLADADALAAGPVAAIQGFPMLLVPGTCVPPSVQAEITRLKVTTIIILGGSAAVSPAVESLTPC